MPLQVESDLHRRRSGRNVGLAVVLVLFVALVFGLSIAKILQGDLMQAFDHQPRASVLPAEPGARIAPAENPVSAPGVPAAAEAPATSVEVSQ